MEILTLGLFCAGLILCIILKFSILYALGAGLVLFWLYGRRKGFAWKRLFVISLEGVMTARNILLTFLLIGVMTALWRAAGTIPVIVQSSCTTTLSSTWGGARSRRQLKFRLPSRLQLPQRVF